MISAWNHAKFWDSRSKFKWHFDPLRDRSHSRTCALRSWTGHSKWAEQNYPRSGAGLSPGSSVGNDSIYKAGGSGDVGSIPGMGRSPGGGNGNPLQYSCLGNLMDTGSWRATVHGVAKSWTWLSDLHFFPSLIYQVSSVQGICACSFLLLAHSLPRPSHMFPHTNHRSNFISSEMSSLIDSN